MKKALGIVIVTFIVSIAVLMQYEDNASCSDVSIELYGIDSDKIVLYKYDDPDGIYNEVARYDDSGQLILDLPTLCSAGLNKDANISLSSIFRIENQSTRVMHLRLFKEGNKKDAFYFGDIEQGIDILPDASYLVSLDINTCTKCEQEQNVLSKIILQVS